MRIVVQRVEKGSVIINKKKHAFINHGLLCFVGFCDSDTTIDFEWAVNKLIKLKLFNNQLSLEDVKGELLIISQFTLYASIKKGTKPSWSRAANPNLAKILYNDFINLCEKKIPDYIQTGIFGSDMKIKSVNDGPVTLILDTKRKE